MKVFNNTCTVKEKNIHGITVMHMTAHNACIHVLSTPPEKSSVNIKLCKF